MHGALEDSQDPANVWSHALAVLEISTMEAMMEGQNERMGVTQLPEHRASGEVLLLVLTHQVT